MAQKLRRIAYMRDQYSIPENTWRWYLKVGRLTLHKLGKTVFIDENEFLQKVALDTAAHAAKRQPATAAQPAAGGPA